MEKVFFSLYHKLYMMFIVVFYFVFGSICIGSAAYVTYGTWNKIQSMTGSARYLVSAVGIIAVVLCIIGTIVYYRMSYRFLFVYSRKYSVSESGLQIKYFTGHTHFYSWSDVADLCLCDVNQNYGGGFDLVIRLGMTSEKAGPLHSTKVDFFNGYDKWRQENYIWKHYKDVIYLEYTKDRLSHIQKISGLNVVDRRTPLGKSRIIEL